MPTDDLATPQPPWVVFPQIKPEELALHVRQGVAEPWFDQEWRPYWASLTPMQRASYLDAWHASPEWREAIAFVFEAFADLDVDQDAKESKEYLRKQGGLPAEKKCSLFRRLFKR
ncbi:hypothetical protein ACNRBV_10205 [Ralstonia pseudosolanacearum]|nr:MULTISPECIES: hypothetical protein [Ralstonia]CUV16931.1 conserved protein of unknown function [Ralstonia solanacearum]UZF23381.1 hypothetical protein LGV80_09350 [Ralstonia sp. RS642]CUV33047.1 conserved protein of unknown function [Ralstonia solanacearum]BCL86722.1 hypothetical protein MAFF211471_18050 [Ralstonia solanacearum]BCL92166.1 hypothetical protein MAFF211479_18670 [Ralstonia solanacearum]